MVCSRALMEFLDTPRTELGNGTFLTTGHDIEDMSLERSFHSPKKRDNALTIGLRKKRGALPQTPAPPSGLSKPSNVRKRQSEEFTPMLKSTKKIDGLAHRSTSMQRSTINPIGLRYQQQSSTGQDTSTGLDSDGDHSKGTQAVAATPLPLITNSSVGSTPLAVPHTRNGNGAHHEQQNQMPLREQEHVWMLNLKPGGQGLLMRLS